MPWVFPRWDVPTVVICPPERWLATALEMDGFSATQRMRVILVFVEARRCASENRGDQNIERALQAPCRMLYGGMLPRRLAQQMRQRSVAVKFWE